MRLINPESTVARMSRTDWLIVAAMVIITLFALQVSASENAAAVALSFGLLAFFVKAKWESRHDPRLWALVGIIAVVQFPATFLVHIPHVFSVLVFYPFALIEGLVLWGLFGWMQRRFPRA